MMQSEKVAQDLNEAYEVVAGYASPVPVLSAALRKLERRGAQAPALVDPSVQALDAALVAIDEARAALEEAFRATEFDPRELEQTEERLFALRPPPANTTCRPTSSPPCASASRRMWPRSMPARSSSRPGSGARRTPRRPIVTAAKALSAGRRKAAQALDAAVQAELPPLKLERARFITEIPTDEDSREPSGFDRVEFWAQTNPGTRPAR